MELRSLLTGLITWAIYPAWLAAGGVDYLCHRNTRIEHTSGAKESQLHVVQLACIAVIVAFAVLAEITLAVFVLLALAALAHSVFAFIDVSYTQTRRRISPLEQTAHGFLEVLPLAAVALLAIMHWPLRTTPTFAWREAIGAGELMLLASFAVLAGAPVFEELWRTLRARRAADGGARGVRGATMAQHDIR